LFIEKEKEMILQLNCCKYQFIGRIGALEFNRRVAVDGIKN